MFKIFKSTYLLDCSFSDFTRIPNYLALSYVWQHVEDDKIFNKFLLEDCICYDENVEYIWCDRYSNKDIDPININIIIKNMNLIYANAKYTLVYDRMLYVMNYKNINDEVLANSDWFKRAWVLQEQLCSQKLIMLNNIKSYDITERVNYIITKNIKLTKADPKFLASLPIMTTLGTIGMSMLPVFTPIAIIMIALDNMISNKAEYDFHEDLHNLKQLAVKGILSPLLVHYLMSSRYMGLKNIDYEPGLALMKNYIPKNEEMMIPLTMLLTDEKRQQNGNNSWKPIRFKHINVKYVNAEPIMGIYRLGNVFIIDAITVNIEKIDYLVCAFLQEKLIIRKIILQELQCHIDSDSKMIEINKNDHDIIKHKYLKIGID